MSVQTEIDRISTAVQNAHLKVIEKGGTSAAPYLVANLPDAIDTIPEATAPKLQAKTATPSETAQTVKPDSGYDGLSQVSVGAISKTYVGSGVTKQAAKTITPSTSSQTAVASGVYTTGAVTVAAIPSSYVKPSATKAATTYTPSTSNQTIAAGTYCPGAQTIKGDANLVAGNIKSGVSIFGVAGSYEGSGGGSSGGGGGSVETCTVTINYGGPPLPNTEAKIYYTDETQTAKDVVFVWGTAYKVIKGSMIRIYCGGYTFPISSGTNYTIVQAHGQDRYYFITGDVTFSVV